MSSSVYKALDVSSIVEIIEAEGIENIIGRPDCHTLTKLLNQLANGARNIECDYSNFGMMWLVIPQNVYQILTGENVVAPMQPPTIPPYLPNGTQQQNAVISLQWQKNKELYDQMTNCNKAHISIMKTKLDQKIRANLSSMFTGTPETTFEAFFNVSSQNMEDLLLMTLLQPTMSA